MKECDKYVSPDYTQYQGLELHETYKWLQILKSFKEIDLSIVTIMLISIVVKDWIIVLISVIGICFLELIRKRHATSSTKDNQSSDELGNARRD
jgi:hypothetical protein